MNGVYFAIFIHFENVFQPELSIGVSKLNWLVSNPQWLLLKLTFKKYV